MLALPMLCPIQQGGASAYGVVKPLAGKKGKSQKKKPKVVNEKIGSEVITKNKLVLGLICHSGTFFWFIFGLSDHDLRLRLALLFPP